MQKNTNRSYIKSTKQNIKTTNHSIKSSLKNVYRSHRSNQYEQSKPLKMPAKCRHPQTKLIGNKFIFFL